MLKFILLLVALLLLAPAHTHAQSDPIDDWIAAMSLRQKVAQLFMVNLYGPILTEAGRDVLVNWQPGAVVLMGNNGGTSQNIVRLTNAYQQTIIEASGPPLFIATDQEGGTIARLRDGFTEWPVPMLLTAADDPDMAMQVGAGMARELLAVGVNMNLAPVADLFTNPDNPIIGRRSPGRDPDQVGRTLAAIVDGMQSAGVMATLKHFPGHGDTSEDSHLTLPVVPHDRDRLMQVELVPFQQAMAAGAVMVGHLWLPEFDPDYPVPASLSANVVAGLLRDNLGYDGIVVTDALDMDAIDTVYTTGEAAVLALQAGVDMVIAGPNIGEPTQIRAMEAVVNAVEQGRLSESRVDTSVRRILAAKEAFGVLDWEPIDPQSVLVAMHRAENAALVAAMFDAGVTIIQDNDDLLPLRRTETIGLVYPANRSQVASDCEFEGFTVRRLAVSDTPTVDDITAASNLSVFVDKIVVFDPDSVLLAMLPAEKTLAVNLQYPVDLPVVSTVLTTYSPLDPAITSACGILFGQQPALGVLPD